jgi:tetraacyldisaccharide 4'-kinase
MDDLGARLQPVWYGTDPPPLALRALVPIWRGLRALHRAPFRFGWRKPLAFAQPLVVVGNLVVGGSGKTPLVIALVEALRARGFAPGVLSRGYGGRVREATLLEDGAQPGDVGDEPCLIHQRTGVPVAVGPDRAASAALLAGQGVDVLVADDGLQNPAIRGDVEICVIDGERRFGNGWLLPAGPPREPLDRLGRVDFRVTNGGIADAGEVPMRLAGGTAVALCGDASRPLSAFAGQRVHAVAGIGHPPRFFASLRAHDIEVVEHAFADHHAYRAEDLAFDDDLPVLMTGKDAVKWHAFARDRDWFVPVRADLPAEFLDGIAQMLRAH